MTTPSKQTPQQKQLIKTVIMMSGFVCILLGLYASMDTKNVSEMIGLKMDVVQIISYVLILVGITDFIIATFLFRSKDRV